MTVPIQGNDRSCIYVWYGYRFVSYVYNFCD